MRRRFSKLKQVFSTSSVSEQRKSLVNCSNYRNAPATAKPRPPSLEFTVQSNYPVYLLEEFLEVLSKERHSIRTVYA